MLPPMKYKSIAGIQGFRLGQKSFRKSNQGGLIRVDHFEGGKRTTGKRQNICMTRGLQSVEKKGESIRVKGSREDLKDLMAEGESS